MATLYELTEELTRLLEDIRNGEIPEEAIEDTLEGLGGEFEEKCDDIASAIKNIRAEAALIKAEEDNLAKRREKKEKLAERLTSYLSSALIKVECKKLESARNSISFRASTVAKVLDKEAYIRWAEINAPTTLKKVVEVKPLLEEIKLKAKTSELPYVEIQTRQNIQIK